MALAYDLGGNDLIVNSITTGATTAGTAVATGISATTPVVIAAATTLKSNVVAKTMTSNIGTVTNYILQCTTPSLTTAAAASQTEVITLTGLAATDIAFVQLAGGTNTIHGLEISAVATTNTLTVNLYNNNVAASALNGTVIFNVWILKA